MSMTTKIEDCRVVAGCINNLQRGQERMVCDAVTKGVAPCLQTCSLMDVLAIPGPTRRPHRQETNAEWARTREPLSNDNILLDIFNNHCFQNMKSCCATDLGFCSFNLHYITGRMLRTTPVDTASDETRSIQDWRPLNPQQLTTTSTATRQTMKINIHRLTLIISMKT